MTIKKTLLMGMGLVLLAGFISGLFYIVAPDKVLGAIANFQPTDCYTAAATSTPTHIASGATSTAVSCFLGTDGARSATMELIYAASTTAAQLITVVEHSMNNQDWYEDSTLYTGATTTPRIGVTAAARYAVQFASSTDGTVEGAGYVCFTGQVARGDCDRKIITIPTVARYVRVYFVTVGGAADIWARVLPRQDVN